MNGVKETYNIPLAKMSLKSWPGRVDTKGIVSAVLVSLAMIGVLQFGERLDTLFFGGLFPVSGRIISFTLIGFGTAMYGGMPGFIVSEINPLIATATGTSPIAPFWLITNGLQVISALIADKIVKKDVISFKFCFIHSFLATIFLTVAYIPMHVFYFKLPWAKLLPMYAFQGAATIIVVPFLLYGLLRTIKNAGFIEE
ncbi:MAG: hypothetical protein AB9917_21665 [Negativicutes bacterium]